MNLYRTRLGVEYPNLLATVSEVLPHFEIKVRSIIAGRNHFHGQLWRAFVIRVGLLHAVAREKGDIRLPDCFLRLSGQEVAGLDQDPAEACSSYVVGED